MKLIMVEIVYLSIQCVTQYFNFGEAVHCTDTRARRHGKWGGEGDLLTESTNIH